MTPAAGGSGRGQLQGLALRVPAIMVALAIDGGIGQGREGQDGHGRVMHQGGGGGQGEAPPERSTSEPAAPMSQARPALPPAPSGQESQRHGHLTRSRPQDSASKAAAAQWNVAGIPPTSRRSRTAVGAAQAVGRHMTKGQRAMAVAMIYPKEMGRGAKGGKLARNLGLSTERVRQARTVL